MCLSTCASLCTWTPMHTAPDPIPAPTSWPGLALYHFWGREDRPRAGTEMAPGFPGEGTGGTVAAPLEA